MKHTVSSNYIDNYAAVCAYGAVCAFVKFGVVDKRFLQHAEATQFKTVGYFACKSRQDCLLMTVTTLKLNVSLVLLFLIVVVSLFYSTLTQIFLF